MNGKPIASSLIIVAVLLQSLTGNCATASENETPAMFRAAEVARRDFASKIENGKKSDWKYAQYVSNIRNYGVGIFESEDYYTVVFIIKKTDVIINGGGAEYRIRKGDLKIVRFAGYE